MCVYIDLNVCGVGGVAFTNNEYMQTIIQRYYALPPLYRKTVFSILFCFVLLS